MLARTLFSSKAAPGVDPLPRNILVKMTYPNNNRVDSTNGVVNNTEYVRWSIDALRRAFEFKGPIRCIQATYFSEVFEGDELDLLLSSAPTGRFCVLGRKPDDQNNVYAAQISF